MRSAPAVCMSDAARPSSIAQTPTVWVVGSVGWSVYSLPENSVPALVALHESAPQRMERDRRGEGLLTNTFYPAICRSVQATGYDDILPQDPPRIEAELAYALVPTVSFMMADGLRHLPNLRRPDGKSAAGELS